MTAPVLSDPCIEITDRAPLRPGERIRVLQLLATAGNGGAQEHTFALVNGMDHDRYEVEVVCLSDGPTVRRFERAGYRTMVIDTPDDREAVDRLVALMLERPPQVIHEHMYRAEIVGTRAALTLAEAGLPRPYIVATVHSSRVRSNEDRDLLRALTAHQDLLIAVSRAIVAKLAGEGRSDPDGHSGPPVALIYNGVDLSRYDEQEACCTLPEEYGFPEGTPMVGCVARLEPEKGIDTLLAAWPRVLETVSDARLLIVGEGSRCDALKDQAEELGLMGDACEGPSCVGTRHARPGAKVVFTGRREDVPAVTAALDVAVLPSYREALGLVVLEAMALSRPVVATNVGGIPEMVQHERTGLLVPPHDAAALADAIVRLLVDHPLADMLARAGHDLVNERFCIERMVQAVETLYDEGAAAVAARSPAAVGTA
ncbi:MAG: glycosyltransferase family 4 protein [Candidatus Limnocylindrales bacterium]